MPIAVVDYRWPIQFIPTGLASSSDHSALRDVHWASPCPMASPPLAWTT
jgi:hypothetical protein